MTVQIEITNLCNLDCQYCYNKANEFRSDTGMTSGQLKNIAEKIVTQLNPISVTLTGGEPTIRKDEVLKLAEIFKKNDIKVVLNTNALLLDDSFIDELKRIDIDKININLESLDPKKHDELRGKPGSFVKLQEVLKKLKNKLNPDKIVIRTVVNKNNLEDLESISDFVKENKFYAHHLLDMIPTRNNEKQFVMDRDDCIRFYEIFENLSKKGIRILPNHALLFLSNFKKEIPITFCMAGRFQMIICANGNIVPCTYFTSDEYVCGNALTDNLMEVWQSSRIMNKFRYSLEGYENCKSCDQYIKCAGGCKALAKSFSGNPFSPDPYCSKYNLKNVSTE